MRFTVAIPSWIQGVKNADGESVVMYRVNVILDSPAGSSTGPPFFIMRRYTQFRDLYEQLKAQHPDTMQDRTLAPPPKHASLTLPGVGQKEAALERRREELEKWMWRLIGRADLARGQVLRSFLEVDRAVARLQMRPLSQAGGGGQAPFGEASSTAASTPHSSQVDLFQHGPGGPHLHHHLHPPHPFPPAATNQGGEDSPLLPSFHADDRSEAGSTQSAGSALVPHHPAHAPHGQSTGGAPGPHHHHHVQGSFPSDGDGATPTVAVRRLGFHLEARGDVRKLAEALERRLERATLDLHQAASESRVSKEVNKMLMQRLAELETKESASAAAAVAGAGGPAGANGLPREEEEDRKERMADATRLQELQEALQARAAEIAAVKEEAAGAKAEALASREEAEALRHLLSETEAQLAASEEIRMDVSARLAASSEARLLTEREAQAGPGSASKAAVTALQLAGLQRQLAEAAEENRQLLANIREWRIDGRSHQEDPAAVAAGVGDGVGTPGKGMVPAMASSTGEGASSRGEAGAASWDANTQMMSSAKGLIEEDERAEWEARCAKAEAEILALKEKMAKDKEKVKSDQIILAKEIKKLRAELSAANQALADTPPPPLQQQPAASPPSAAEEAGSDIIHLLRSRIAELEAEVAAASAAAATAAAESAASKAQAEHQAHQARDEIAALERRHASELEAQLAAQMTVSSSSQADSQATMSSLRDQVCDLEAQLSESSRALSETQGEAAELKQLWEEQEEEIRALKVQLEKHTTAALVGNGALEIDAAPSTSALANGGNAALALDHDLNGSPMGLGQQQQLVFGEPTPAPPQPPLPSSITLDGKTASDGAEAANLVAERDAALYAKEAALSQLANVEASLSAEVERLQRQVVELEEGRLASSSVQAAAVAEIEAMLVEWRGRAESAEALCVELRATLSEAEESLAAAEARMQGSEDDDGGGGGPSEGRSEGGARGLHSSQEESDRFAAAAAASAAAAAAHSEQLLEHLRAQIRDQAAELEAATVRLEALSSLEERCRELQAQTDEVPALQRRCLELKLLADAVPALEQRCLELQAQTEGVRALEKRCMELQAQVEGLERGNGTLQAQVEDLNSLLEASKGAEAQLSGRVKEMEGRMEEAADQRGEIDRLQDALALLQQQHDLARKERASSPAGQGGVEAAPAVGLSSAPDDLFFFDLPARPPAPPAVAAAAAGVPFSGGGGADVMDLLDLSRLGDETSSQPQSLPPSMSAPQMPQSSAAGKAEALAAVSGMASTVSVALSEAGEVLSRLRDCEKRAAAVVASIAEMRDEGRGGGGGGGGGQDAMMDAVLSGFADVGMALSEASDAAARLAVLPQGGATGSGGDCNDGGGPSSSAVAAEANALGARLRALLSDSLTELAGRGAALNESRVEGLLGQLATSAISFSPSSPPSLNGGTVRKSGAIGAGGAWVGGAAGGYLPPSFISPPPFPSLGLGSAGPGGGGGTQGAEGPLAGLGQQLSDVASGWRSALTGATGVGPRRPPSGTGGGPSGLPTAGGGGNLGGRGGVRGGA